MGLFDRLRTLVSSNVNSALDAAEGVGGSVTAAIDELKRETALARQDLVKTIAAKKQHDAKAVELDGEAEAWEQRAAVAVRNGDDALAREGLARKLQSAKRADEARALAAARAADELRMRELLERAEGRLRELESRRHSLEADLRRARGGAVGAEGAGSRLEQSLGRVDALDAELEAHAVLDDPRRREVDAELRKLDRAEHDVRVDDELEALKRKLGG